VRDSYRVKRDKLFEILQNKNIPNLLLKSVIEICSGNKIKVKINNKLSEEHAINHGVREGCPLSPSLFNIYFFNKYKIKTLLFAGDQNFIDNSEHNLLCTHFALYSKRQLRATGNFPDILK
jgi:hypothetical protein